MSTRTKTTRKKTSGPKPEHLVNAEDLAAGLDRLLKRQRPPADPTGTDTRKNRRIS